MRRCAVSIDGAVLPGGRYDQAIQVCTRPHEKANVVLSSEEIINAVGRPLYEVEEDWLDFLRAIHTADLVCHRGDNEDWTRNITLSLPLRNPATFNPFLPLIQEVFGRMTHHSLNLSLETDPAPPPQR